MTSWIGLVRRGWAWIGPFGTGLEEPTTTCCSQQGHSLTRRLSSLIGSRPAPKAPGAGMSNCRSRNVSPAANPMQFSPGHSFSSPQHKVPWDGHGASRTADGVQSESAVLDPPLAIFNRSWTSAGATWRLAPPSCGRRSFGSSTIQPPWAPLGVLAHLVGPLGPCPPLSGVLYHGRTSLQLPSLCGGGGTGDWWLLVFLPRRE